MQKFIFDVLGGGIMSEAEAKRTVDMIDVSNPTSGANTVPREFGTAGLQRHERGQSPNRTSSSSTTTPRGVSNTVVHKEDGTAEIHHNTNEGAMAGARVLSITYKDFRRYYDHVDTKRQITKPEHDLFLKTLREDTREFLDVISAPESNLA